MRFQGRFRAGLRRLGLKVYDFVDRGQKKPAVRKPKERSKLLGSLLKVKSRRRDLQALHGGKVRVLCLENKLKFEFLRVQAKGFETYWFASA